MTIWYHRLVEYINNTGTTEKTDEKCPYDEYIKDQTITPKDADILQKQKDIKESNRPDKKSKD